MAVASLTVALNASTASFAQSMEGAVKKSRQTAGQIQRSMNSVDARRARDSVDLLSQRIGVGLPYAMKRAMASSRLLGGALSAAFPLAAGVAFASIIASQVVPAIRKAAERMAGLTDSLKASVAEITKLNTALLQTADRAKAISREILLVGKGGAEAIRMRLGFQESDIADAEQQLRRLMEKREELRRAAEATVTRRVSAGVRGMQPIEVTRAAPGAAAAAAELEGVENRILEASKALNLMRLEATKTAKELVHSIGPATDEWDKYKHSVLAAEAAMRKSSEAQFLKAQKAEAQDLAEAVKSLPSDLEAANQAFAALFAPPPGPTGIQLVLDDIARRGKEIVATMAPIRDAAQRVWEQTRTPLEKYNAELVRLNELHRAGAISGDTLARATAQAAETFKGAAHTMKDLAHTIGNAFEDSILQLQSARSIMAGLVQDIARMILRTTITGPGGIFGKLFSGVGSLFGGKRAMGGPVVPGKAFLVGERGPEMFVPRSAGTIKPNAGGVTNHYHIDARGAQAGVEHLIARAIEAAAPRIVAASVATTAQLQHSRA